MFRGANSISIDLKGRVAMPVRYRDDVMNICGGQLVVTADLQYNCLLIYPRAEWLDIEARLEQLPSFNRAARTLQRFMVGHAKEVEMDRQGRMLIPPELRELVGLDRQAVLVGQMKKFELWDEQDWNEECKKDDPEDGFELPEGYESLTF